jgi:hypothetical protein
VSERRAPPSDEPGARSKPKSSFVFLRAFAALSRRKKLFAKGRYRNLDDKLRRNSPITDNRVEPPFKDWDLEDGLSHKRSGVVRDARKTQRQVMKLIYREGLRAAIRESCAPTLAGQRRSPGQS